MDSKKCLKCGNKYIRSKKNRVSHKIWKNRKFCSRLCTKEAQSFRKPFNRFSSFEDKIHIFFRKEVIIIDHEDLSKINYCHWNISSFGYARNGKHQKLHHLIVGKPPLPLVTDHINRNKLDNRKCNLRFVTVAINNKNKDYKKNKTH